MDAASPAMSHPALREELALFEGPRLADGQPSWTLHDPVRNQFFRIDWLTFEILSRWHLPSWQEMVEQIRTATPLRPEADDVAAVSAFLQDKQLVRTGGLVSARALAEQQARQQGGWASWLLHHYLFFRIPLLRPDAWLGRWAGAVAPLYSRGFAVLTGLALLLGALLIYRDWVSFSTTLLDTFSLSGVLGFGATLVGVKVLHEMAHAFTAKRYGCRVPVMGVAFLVMVPVAYTDTNEVWKLSSRRQRLAVAAAGVTAELVVAVWAGLAWALLPPGLPRSIAFMLCTTTWIATLAINASPFMRFDGYFLLSDWLDLPNLHSRAFALARWDLRERLLGLGAPPPEHFARRRRIGLILFAYATWLYRVVLFLGIAALVYGFFIKALGILLFMVEIGWFLVLPVWQELRQWPKLLLRQGTPAGQADASRGAKLRRMWQHGPRVRRTVLVVLGLVALLLVPLPKRISAKGLLKPAEAYPIHAPSGAQVAAMPWTEGAHLEAGELIVELASPELQWRWQQAQARVAQQRQLSSHAAVTPDQRQNLQVLQQAEHRALAELAGVEADMALYAPRAPFAGVLRNMDPDLRPGQWVAEHERLAVLVRAGPGRVETYLDEEAVGRIKVGDVARFYADGGAGPVVRLQVTDIEMDATRQLPNGQLAAQFGGSVLTRERRGQLVPELAVYRVTLASQADLGSLAGQSWRGTVVVHGGWEAPGMSILRSALTLAWRELGF